MISLKFIRLRHGYDGTKEDKKCIDMEIVYLIVGLVMGIGGCGFYFRGKVKAVREISDEKMRGQEELFTEKLDSRQQRLDDVSSELEKLKEQFSELNSKLSKEIELRSGAEQVAAGFNELKGNYEQSQGEITRLKSELASLESKTKEVLKNADEKIELIKSARQEMTDSFKALSVEALKNNNQAFVEMAGDKMINPMKETLSKVDVQLKELEKSRTQAYAGLTEQVKFLSEGQKQLHSETSSLVQALRRPEGRGRWGEMQLQRVAELAGMVEYCDFVTQDSVRDGDGKLQRPDMIVNLPGEKTIVVDSKVSLSAYLEALEAKESQQKESLLAKHALQVREHFKQLGQKTYWSNYDGSPEFVVLFIPGESFFSAALERDPQLIEYGIERNIIIATPTTLIAMLKAAAYGWRQEKVAENARKISDLGKELYERICVMSGYFDEIRKGLEKSVGSYNKAVGALESRVLVTARRFNEMGVDSGKKLGENAQITTSPRSIGPGE